MDTYLGIDFGTTNSVVCVLAGLNAIPVSNGYEPMGDEPEIYQWITPTVLAFDQGNHLFFGLPAKKCGGNILLSIKRLLGSMDETGHESIIIFDGKSYYPSQIACYFFKVLKLQTEKMLNKSVNKVVITIPSNSKGPQRFLTRFAAQSAGFEVATLINEPTAAAMAYARKMNYSEDDEKIFLVYDFGGGTFDATLLRLTGGLFYEVGSNGIGKMGGDDLDLLLAQLIMKKTGTDIPVKSDSYTHFKISCEHAKIELSSKDEIEFRFSHDTWNLHCPISRKEFEHQIQPLIYRTLEKIDNVIHDYKNENRQIKNAKPSLFIDHVLLVGGTSKIPLVQKIVASHLGMSPEPITETDPMLCVALGAALANGIFHQQLPFDYHVKLEHSLCTYLIRRPGMTIHSIRDSFNAVLPFLKSESFISHLKRLIEGSGDLLSKLISDTPEIGDLQLLKEQIEEQGLTDVQPSGFIFFAKYFPSEIEKLKNPSKIASLIQDVEKLLQPGMMYLDIPLLQRSVNSIDNLLNIFTQRQLDPLINRGTGIPVDSNTEKIGLDYQLIEGIGDHYALTVYEGNELDFPHHSDNFPLKNLSFPIPANADRNTYLVKIKYKYGEDGILVVEKSASFYDKTNGKFIEDPLEEIPMFDKKSQTIFPAFNDVQKIIQTQWAKGKVHNDFRLLAHTLLENNPQKATQIIEQSIEINPIL